MHDGVVRTDRLLLRPWRPADRAPFAEMNASPRVMEWFPSTLTRAESDALADRIAEGIGRHGWGEWAVEVPGVADFVGFIGLSSAEATLGYPAVEVGWRLAADYWGRGYAPEGALAALAFGFGQLGLDEIVSFTSVGNTRSRRVMEKTGMTGRPEDDFDHPSLPDGSPLKRHVLYRVAATSHRPEVSATAGMARSAPVEHGEAVVAQGRLAGVVPMNELLDVLPDTAAGQRAKWVWKQLCAMAAGAAGPSAAELAEQYAPGWLAEVAAAVVLSELAPRLSAVTSVHHEPVSRPNEVRVLLELTAGNAVRFRCEVEATSPYRIVFQLVSPAMAPSTYVDRLVQRDGREVRIRDFGGEGPLLLLWHGAGCDVTVWEAMVPHLRAFHVVAQDLPGHGQSPLGTLSAADAASDADALVAELGLGEPILVGHSLGGWLALHFAATRPCRALVCLDGPSTLDYAAMGLPADHPGFVDDPPDVRADLELLRSPTLIVLCGGTSQSQAEGMVPFRRGLHDYVTRTRPHVRVTWQSTDHMIVLSQPGQSAALITEFVRDVFV